MRLSGWQWLAVSSIVLSTLAVAETRPQYGATLRTATSIAPLSLDPAAQPDTVAKRNLTRLMFETLVTMDDRGRLRATLATSWQAAPGNQRWQFWVRRGVKFHDGSPLTPEAVAAALRAVNPDWSVLPAADSVIIERNVPDSDLPAGLARPRNAITKRSEGGTLIGTGPFHIADWQAGKKLALAANENYWGGRPFLDGVEIELGKSSRDQLLGLDLGKVDIAEVVPEQSHRVSTEGRRVMSSAPVELMALVFARDRQSPEEGKLREALSLSIDRSSIRSVVLQSAGEPSGGILPNWMSGYAFVFGNGQNLDRARELRSEVPRAPAQTLAYDPADPLARVIAERIALNARDAGITLQTTTSAASDIRLVRLPLASLNPRVALLAVAASAGVSTPKFSGNSTEDMYQAESGMLRTQRIIPLFQLAVSYALSPAVKDWNLDRDGGEHLENVWMGSKP
jgi:MarR-like DNA-binding transcriptional regulator SgrR of sgrS sRNA